jgi:hypothetical protein
VKVFTMRNLKDFNIKDIFRGYVDKKFYGCPIKVYLRKLIPIVYSTRHVSYDSENDIIDITEWEIDFVKKLEKHLI